MSKKLKTLQVNPSFQKLSQFSVPKGFRGRPAWFVQLWWLVQSILIYPSPQFMYGWRRFWLRAFGAKIGKGVIIRPTVRITYPWKLKIGDYAWVGDYVELYTLGNITIGSNAVVSQYSYLCTGSHDYKNPAFTIFAKPIVIEPEAWVASGAFIAPGVHVGHAAIVAARASVVKDVPTKAIVAGVPAKRIGTR